MKKTYTEFMTKLEKIKKIKQEKKAKLAKRISMSVVATCLVIATTFGVQNSSKLFNLTGKEGGEVSAITAEAGENAQDVANGANGGNNASEVAMLSEENITNFKTAVKNMRVEINETGVIDIIDLDTDLTVTNKQAFTWTSSDDEIATVDSNGVVTGKKAGRAKITVANGDGVSDICNVIISDAKSRASVELGSGIGVALKIDGTVWAWGTNAKNNLGTGTTGAEIYPKPVLDTDGVTQLDDVIQIDAQRYSVADGASTFNFGGGGVALKSNGTVVTWGINNMGELGDGTNTTSNKAVQVIKTDDSILTDVVEIAASEQHVLALTSKGEVYSWGKNTYGELGDGTKNNSNKAKKVNLENIVYIQTCDNSSYFIDENEELYAIGENSNYQLGSGTKSGIFTKIDMKNIKQIVGAYNATAILKNDGTVWTVGSNANGRLGNGLTSGYSTNFKQVLGPNGSGKLENIEKMGCYFGGFYAINKDGKMYSWGYAGNGAIGTGSTTDRRYPTEVKGRNGGVLEDKIIDVTKVGGGVGIAIKEDGSLLGVGGVQHGVIGVSTSITRTSFEEIFEQYLEFEERQMYVRIGETVSTNVTSSKGFNLYNNLPSTEGITYKSSNEDIATVDGNGRITGKSRGEVTIVAENENGDKAMCIVYVISNNPEAITLPSVTVVGSNFTSSNKNSTIILKEDGTVWTVGSNYYAALGNGTIGGSSLELQQVKISETEYLRDVVKIAENNIGLALTKSGEVYAWGMRKLLHIRAGSRYFK